MQKERDYAERLYKAFVYFFSRCLEKESLAVMFDDPSSFEIDKNSETRFQVSIYVAGFFPSSLRRPVSICLSGSSFRPKSIS